MAKAIFGAGCFWGVEYLFRQIPGVREAICGYSGGHVDKPTYEQVCSGRTGHAEVVEVDFDPAKVSYEQLLDAFFQGHDPTTLNRQGPDVGTQYRSAIYYVDESQRAAAEQTKAQLSSASTFKRPIVTEITPAGAFWRAEEYHQRYFEKHNIQGCHL
jgi:peptide-methionine (S)-S-oxide reductase